MSKWNMPKVVNDMDLGFGVRNMSEYLPAMSEIPEEFKNNNGRGSGEGQKWVRIVDDWFFSGIRNLHVELKEGIDRKTAMRHVSMIMHSFDPSHEHKTAGVAYLISRWFTIFDYEVVKDKGE